MKATVLDTFTGKTAQDDHLSTFDWAEGDWSCDCNRAVYFGVLSTDPLDCDGCVRFLVVAAEHNMDDDYECNLNDLNEGYPEDLVKKHCDP